MSLGKSLKDKLVVWLWKNSMTCKNVTRLASESLDHSLPLMTRIRMRLHILGCVWCERYTKQLKSMHEAAPHFDEHLEAASKKSLSGDAKERMKQALLDKKREP